MVSSLIVLIVILYRRRIIDGFQGSLDMPSAKELINPPISAVEANDGFRKVLAYMETNPKNSGEFLNFLKSSFFTPSSKFNPDINFAKVSELWKGGTFRDKSTDV